MNGRIKKTKRAGARIIYNKIIISNPKRATAKEYWIYTKRRAPRTLKRLRDCVRLVEESGQWQANFRPRRTNSSTPEGARARRRGDDGYGKFAKKPSLSRTDITQTRVPTRPSRVFYLF